MSDTVQQMSDIARAMDEMSTLQVQLVSTPGDRALETRLFHVLNTVCKNAIEQCDIPRAISFLREMQRYHNNEEQLTLIYGWNIFHTLKAISTDDYSKRHYPKAVPELAGSFISLNYQRPSQLHSAVIAILCKLAQERADWFFPLVRQAGFDSLQESDFQPFAKDGKKITPLAETLFLKLAKALERSTDQADNEWLLAAIETHRKKLSDNQWISYYYGKLLLKLDRFDDAKKFIKEILNRHKAQFWAWAILGETFKAADKEVYLACLCKALSFPTESTLLLNVREELAHLLKEMNFLPEAKTEIEAIMAMKRQLDLPIPEELLAYTYEYWWQNTESKPNNLDFYLKRLPAANELLKDDSTPVAGIVTANYEGNKGVFIQFELDKVALLKYGKTASQETFAVGDIVAVCVQEVSIGGQRRYEALRAEAAAQVPSSDFVRKISGELKLPQKTENCVFGFVNDVYAPPDTIKGIPAGTKVSGLAIKEFNKKRNQYGWRALLLRIEPNAEPVVETNAVQEPVTEEKGAAEPETVIGGVAGEFPVPGEIST